MAQRRLGMIAFLLCLCLCLTPCTAHAASTADAVEAIDPARACTLTLTCRSSDAAYAGVPVKLYQFATVSADFRYTLTPAFADTALELNGIQTTGEWNVVRSTLESHILANSVSATANAATDADGEVSFESLEPGLYLAVVDPAERNGWICTFDAALVALPGLGTDGLWQYQVDVTCKSELIPPIEGDDKDEIPYKVIKLWKTEGSTVRPTPVEIEIFCNGVSMQTVTLSDDNLWTYTWTAPADGSNWMVVERNVPDGCTVTVEKRAASFIVTNSAAPQDTPPSSPKTGDTSNILLYTLLMSISGTVLVLLGVTAGKKRV